MVRRLLLSVLVVSGVTSQSEVGFDRAQIRLMADYHELCGNWEGGPEGYSRCLKVAKEWHARGPRLFGKRVAWLMSAQILREMRRRTLDPELASELKRREHNVYAEVLREYPNEGYALFAFASDQPTLLGKISSFRQLVKSRPQDAAGLSMLALLLWQSGEIAARREAIKILWEAWEATRGTPLEPKFSLADSLVAYTTRLDGSVAGDQVLEKIRESCGAIQALRDVELSEDRKDTLDSVLNALAKVVYPYCQDPYVSFEAKTCALARSKLTAILKVTPRSYEALKLAAAAFRGEVGEDRVSLPPNARRLADLYKRMLEVSPGSADAAWGLTTVQDDYSEQVGRLEEVIRVADQVPSRVRLSLAEAYSGVGEHRRAIEVLRTAYRLAETRRDRWRAGSELLESLLNTKQFYQAGAVSLQLGDPVEEYRESAVFDPGGRAPICVSGSDGSS